MQSAGFLTLSLLDLFVDQLPTRRPDGRFQWLNKSQAKDLKEASISFIDQKLSCPAVERFMKIEILHETFGEFSFLSAFD
jgi:uncharacterized membrane protein YqhA